MTNNTVMQSSFYPTDQTPQLCALCHLLTTFANNFDLDKVRPDMDSLMVFLKEFFEKVNFEKYHEATKSVENYSVGKKLNPQTKPLNHYMFF